jgi:ceramide glucosyltransferase
LVIAFWVLALLALGLASAQLATAWRVRGFHRPIDSDVARERPPLSLLVPLHGAAPGLRARLEGALAALRPTDELLLAVETSADPAYAVAEALRSAHPGRRLAIVLSGPAGARMGKQHNLAAALPRAAHELVAFMDDDVELDGPVLDEGARTAGAPGAGAAFALPYAAGRGPVGGAIVAAYTNYAFSPAMGALALQGAPKFLIGGFWVVARPALDAAGGLEAQTRTVSDDAALGRALHAAGFRNRALRRPVRLAHEPLDLAGGVRQLLKWLTLLRAEGAALYLVVALAWNPLAIGVAAGLVGWAAPALPPATVAAAVGLVALARVGAVLALDRTVYRAVPRGRYLAITLLHEALLAPWLFLAAAGRREVDWRGRRYRIGRGGAIVEG